MTSTLTHLSSNAISSLTKQNSDSQPIFVQVIEFQLKKDKHYLIISDGSFMIKALPKDQHILNPETDLNSIISIKRHIVSKSGVVGISDFQKVFNYKAKIGNPQEFNADSINTETNETFMLQQSLIDLKLENPEKQQTTLKQQQKPTDHQVTVKKQTNPQGEQKVQTQRKFVPPPAPRALSGNLKDYETIHDLWIGMDRWTIVCRIVKMQYKEFISKKSGKDTKVLNLELMDRAGMKISGAFFGQAAMQFKDTLVKDRVYKISQGQIREESYNNSKNQKMSPYKLVFTNLSTFDEVSDTNSIAKNEDSAITLGDCVERRILGQQFDIVCILINIEDTVEVKKEEKLLKRTNLLVADPVKNLTMHACVWNQNLIPDRSLIGKAIILSRFKLTQYRSSLALSSIFKSCIIPVESHQYQQLEKQAMNEYANYEKLHEIKSVGNQIYEVCTTIRQLQQKVESLGFNEWAKAELTVFVNRFALKKWHYDGCPHCGKAAESLNNCSHCHKYVQKTIGNFIMGTQISDATGSIWTTAYNQWAKKIFNVVNQAQIIDYFLGLDANQLRQQTESYLYQQFKLRISSKKDNQGKVKHNVQKVYDRNFAEETMKNVELISRLSIY